MFLLDGEFTFVVEFPEVGVDSNLGGKVLVDDHPDAGIGLCYGKVRDAIADIELDAAGKFANDPDVTAERTDPGIAVVLKDDFAVGDVAEGGFAEFDVDIADVGEVAGGQAAVFACQVDQSLEVGDFSPPEIVMDVQGVPCGHVDDVVDIEGPVVTAVVMSGVAMGMDLADMGMEGDQVV